MVEEALLTALEEQYPCGLTSAQLLELFASWSVAMSEATLRKYVQVGLLPHSVRVGRKGNRGSQGIYPVAVVRQILRIKKMLAQSFTIEQIQRDVLFVSSDLQRLESTLTGIFATLREVVHARRHSCFTTDVASDLEGATGIGSELLSRLQAIESRLSGAAIHHGLAV
jgi:DNA-binding transcriptional MerR regulator